MIVKYSLLYLQYCTFYIYISHGSVAMLLRYGGIFTNHYIEL